MENRLLYTPSGIREKRLQLLKEQAEEKKRKPVLINSSVLET